MRQTEAPLTGCGFRAQDSFRKERMDDDGSLRLEYEAASQLLRGLTETRFKLLALVPTLAGAVVGFASAQKTGVALLAIGLLGLTATVGVLLYELRNGQIQDDVARRVQELEELLFPGKRLVRRAGTRVFGLVPASQSLGVALVYGAAISGWCYLVCWGALRSIGVHHHGQSAGLVIGAAAGVVAVVEIARIERGGRQPSGGDVRAESNVAAS
jgi:hypothetical protein